MATIAGTRAATGLPGPFYQPGNLVLTRAGSGTQPTYTEPTTAHDALHFEAAEVVRCIAAGHLQSPLRPLDDSVTTLRAMEEIRPQCGIVFPAETEQRKPPAHA